MTVNIEKICNYINAMNVKTFIRNHSVVTNIFSSPRGTYNCLKLTDRLSIYYKTKILDIDLTVLYFKINNKIINTPFDVIETSEILKTINTKVETVEIVNHIKNGVGNTTRNNNIALINSELNI